MTTPCTSIHNYYIHLMLSTTDVVSDGAWLGITRSLLVMPTRFLQHSAYPLWCFVQWQVAAQAVTSTPQLLRVALCAAALQLVWIFTAGIASAGSAHARQTVLAPDGGAYRAIDCYSEAQSSCTCDGNLISDNSQCELSTPNQFLLLTVVLVRGNSTIANVVTATIGCSIGTWWSSPGDLETAWASCHRVLRSSPG